MKNEKPSINWALSDKWPRVERPKKVGFDQNTTQSSLGDRFPELAILRYELSQTPEGLIENFTSATELMLTKGIVPKFQRKIMQEHKAEFNAFLKDYFQA